MAESVEVKYSKMNRGSFPKGFVFGVGTSAYQVEGAAAKGGRGISIWDDFTMGAPNKIDDKSNGNVACDMYHRYKEDIKMMKNMGFDAYRFSISWPRLIPSGKISLGVNTEGVDYYNDLIDTVCKNGMKPHVTLFHWDLPDLLQKGYDGFLSHKIVDDYVDYVDLCFGEFGDRVKHWATFNEPWTYCYTGYVVGKFPPGAKVAYDAPTVPRQPDIIKCLHDYRMSSSGLDLGSDSGNSTTKSNRRKLLSGEPEDDPDNAKPFIAAKHMIVAHAKAVDLYKTKFKGQGGEIGIVLNNTYFEPFDGTNQKDIDAARRVHDYKFGWFLEPILTGKYPKTMHDPDHKHNVARVPYEAEFTNTEFDLLKKSKIDFLGLNYYSARYVQHKSNPDSRYGAHDKRQQAELQVLNKDKKRIGEQRHPDWLVDAPHGIKKLLEKIDEYYNNSEYNCPAIYITENGVAQHNNHELTLAKAIEDKDRVNYYRNHLGNLWEVINEWKSPKDQKKKLEIKGYFAWSWVDNFEWDHGYTARFGIMYVDYFNDLKRYPKLSAIWFSKFLGGVVPELLYGVDAEGVAMPPYYDPKSDAEGMGTNNES